jgi:integrase
MARPPSQPFANDLNEAFLALLDRVSERHPRTHLRGFFGFASTLNLTPEDVTEAHVGMYEAEIAGLGNKRSKQAARNVANAWNLMADTLPDWPQRRLTAQDNRGWLALPLDAFPPSLAQDVEAYLHASSGEDIFAEWTDKPLAERTMLDRRNKIRQLLTHAVDAGIPAETFKKLSDLFDNNIAQAVLRRLWEINERKPNHHAANLARLMRFMGKHWANAPESTLKSILSAEKNFTPEKQGMTERNRAKLRVIIEEENTRRILTLPQKLFDRVKDEAPTIRNAHRLQSALGVAILACAPIREKNLTHLSLSRHFHRVSKTECYVVIPAFEVKNTVDLEYPLPPHVITMLDAYVERFLPLLAKDQPIDLLFISNSGRHKLPSEIGAQIPKFILEETGLNMNVHLFRHFAGYLYLKTYPGEYEVVRQLLGHKSVKTTIDFYLGLEQHAAFKRYDAVIASHLEKKKEDDAA